MPVLIEQTGKLLTDHMNTWERARADFLQPSLAASGRINQRLFPCRGPGVNAGAFQCSMEKGRQSDGPVGTVVNKTLH